MRIFKIHVLYLSVVMGMIFLVIAQSGSGHSLGQSLEKKVNNYLIDIGHSAVDKIYTDEAIRFDFNLWIDKRTEKIADFDYVWVRIAPREEGIVFAGFLYRPEFLLTGMSYTFQKAGEYEITARFLDRNDKILAEAAFPLIVEKDKIDILFVFWMISSAVGGLILGILAALFFRKKNHQIN